MGLILQKQVVQKAKVEIIKSLLEKGGTRGYDASLQLRDLMENTACAEGVPRCIVVEGNVNFDLNIVLDH